VVVSKKSTLYFEWVLEYSPQIGQSHGCLSLTTFCRLKNSIKAYFMANFFTPEKSVGKLADGEAKAVAPDER
jgi:hypothetical protein